MPCAGNDSQVRLLECIIAFLIFYAMHFHVCNSFAFKDLLIFVFLHTVCFACIGVCVYRDLGGQKSASETLELELQTVVSHYVGAGS